MEGLKEYFRGFAHFIGRMTPSQVMMLLGVTAGTLVGIVLLVGWLGDATYARLYTNLDEKEAGEVIAWLQDNKVEYQLLDGGRTIEVPAGKVYSTRIALATEGLPNSGQVGYSIFDQNNLGMTDFLQNLNFRRALEGEITKTIMQLDEVDAARVHIVMPKDRLFKEDQQEATASVVLKLRGSDKLSRQQVAGITHLVAASVEGLEPDNITIVDYGGNLLSSVQQADATIGLSNSQLEITQRVERHLQGKAQSMLDEVMGPGKSVVRVTAKLDFQQLERTSEVFDPNAPSIRSEERIKESSKEADKAAETAESESEDQYETTRTNYELNKTVEHVIDAVGTIDRLTVAVMVDGVYEEVTAEDGTSSLVYKPRSTEELDRLESIVRTAVGFDTERNDQIEMVNIAFDRRDLKEDRQALDAMYMRDFYMEIATKVGWVLLALIALLYFRKKARKLFASLGQILPPPKPTRTEVSPVENEPEEDEEIKPLRPERRKPKLVERMQETAKEQPEEIAKVIKTLMVD